MIEEKFTDFVDYFERGIEPIERTGVKVLECRDMHIKLMLPIEGNKNHFGVILGGSLMVLAEISGGAIFGVTFDAFKYLPIVKEVTIKFKKPAFTDVTITVDMVPHEVSEIQAVLDDKGKADYTLDYEIKDAGDNIVAVGQGIYQVRNIPEGMENPMAKGLPGE